MTKARTALRLALGALLPPCARAQIAFAEQVVVTPFKDNTIFSEANYSSGAGNSLFAGMNANFDLRRTLIAFPVQGYVPPGSAIQSATMSIWLTESRFGGDATLHRLFANWGEAGSDSGSSDQGDFPQDGDATWDYRFYSFFNPQEWNTRGGDFDPTVSSSQSFAPTFGVTQYDFASTPTMVADVQHWLDFGGNFGWILIGDETQPSGLRFDSREGNFLDTVPILTITYSPPARPEWNVDADGSWGDPNNWSAAVPDSPSAVANFLGKITAPRTITLDGNRTVAELHFDNANTYTIAPGNPGDSTLTVGQAGAPGSITSGSGGHIISAKVVLPGGANVNVAGDGALHFTGGMEIGFSQALIKSGDGSISIAGPQTHQPGAVLVISSGGVYLGSNAGAPATANDSAQANLTITVNGSGGVGSFLILNSSQDLYRLDIDTSGGEVQQVDLRSTASEFHALRIHGGDLDFTRSVLQDAINTARANQGGDGIFDSGLHANSAIGIAKLIDAYNLEFLLIRPTRIGDLNLDGTVTIADFVQLAAHFNQSGLWQEGDINGDGQVTIADFIALASNFNQGYTGDARPISDSDQQTLAAFATANGVALVPEPATLSLLLLFPLHRRRRRNCLPSHTACPL